MRYEVEVAGRVHHVQVERESGRFVVTIGGRTRHIDAVRVGPRGLSLLIDDEGRTRSHEVVVAPGGTAGQFGLRVQAAWLPVAVNGARRHARQDQGTPLGTGPERIVAPMPGKIVRLLVQHGDRVSARQPIVVIEAMKMENELRAGRDGIAVEILVQPGQSVEAGTLLVVVAPA